MCPELKFKIEDLAAGVHACRDQDCGDLARRLIRRTRQFQQDAGRLNDPQINAQRLEQNNELQAMMTHFSLKVGRTQDAIIKNGYF